MPRISRSSMSAAFSAIMIVGALVFPDTMRRLILAYLIPYELWCLPNPRYD